MLDGSLPFAFHFQPIVDIRQASVVGYEALVRFPEETGLAPDRCLRVAEACGRRLDLEEALIHRALAVRSSIPPNCFLTINTSPTFLLTKRWDDLLAGTESLDGIVVEITEQDIVEDYDAMRTKVAAIRSHRGLVAVDDTGSGYASLKHVIELKPDFVKLDRSFVGTCNFERSKTTLIEMIGMATDRLDAWIVAEGVETAAELEELVRLEVPLAQGFYLGVPAPTMLPLAPSIAAEIRLRLHAVARPGSIAAHKRRCFLCSTRAEAESHLEAHPEDRVAVVLDQWRRPVELHEVHPLVGHRRMDGFLRVQCFSDPTEVLQRALTRPEATHFDPFVLIDEQGEFQGVVSVDRLMRAILDAPAR